MSEHYTGVQSTMTGMAYMLHISQKTTMSGVREKRLIGKGQLQRSNRSWMRRIVNKPRGNKSKTWNYRSQWRQPWRLEICRRSLLSCKFSQKSRPRSERT